MANGTIAFDTLSTSGQISGTAVSVDTDYLAYGSNKCWGNYNASQALQDSFNVSSHDDDGGGDGGVNINNNMANNDYAITSACSDATASDQILTLELTQNSEATTAFDYETNRAGSSVNRTAIDTNRMIALFGDLA